MSVAIEILKAHTPDGSACDGEFGSAVFKVLSTSDGNEITREELQQLLLTWNADCHLNSLGYFKDTKIQGGLLMFVDDYPPEAYEIIELQNKETTHDTIENN